MDNIEEQIKLLAIQGHWVNQKCVEWVNRAIADFARNGKIGDDLIKESKELLGRSEQWCKDVDKTGLRDNREGEDWKNES